MIVYRVRTYKSEEALKEALNDIDVGTIRDVVSKGAEFTVINVVDIDDVLAKYTNLTAPERTALENFIAAELDAGNLQQYDEFYPFFLTDSADSLKGFFGKVATNNGATKVAGAWSFDGIDDYIDTNWTPSVDADDYVLGSGVAAAYVLAVTPSNANLFGVDSLFGSGTFIHSNGSNVISGQIQATNPILIPESIVYQPKTLYGVDRLDDEYRILIDGVVKGTLTGAPQPLQTNSVPVGCLLDTSFAPNYIGFFDGQISSMLFAGRVGFNWVTHLANYNALLTELGILP